jgi:hypothetical protein
MPRYILAPQPSSISALLLQKRIFVSFGSFAGFRGKFARCCKKFYDCHAAIGIELQRYGNAARFLEMGL